MRPWSEFTNDELAYNLELWLLLDGRVQDEHQTDFFIEVIRRLNQGSKEIEH